VRGRSSKTDLGPTSLETGKKKDDWISIKEKKQGRPAKEPKKNGDQSIPKDAKMKLVKKGGTRNLQGFKTERRVGKRNCRKWLVKENWGLGGREAEMDS